MMQLLSNLVWHLVQACYAVLLLEKGLGRQQSEEG